MHTFNNFFWGVGFLFIFAGMPSAAQQIESPFECQDILRGIPPFPDGRVSFYCDRAYYSCLLEKLCQVQLQTLSNMSETPEKKQKVNHIEKILSQNKAEKETYLRSCQFAFNFFANSDLSQNLQTELSK